MFIKIFKELSKNDVAVAGGKGASLGEMTSAGIPVPPGFVVLASAFDRFLEETDLNVEIAAKLKKVKLSDLNSVDRASNEIRDLILDAEFPKDLASEIMGAYKKLFGRHQSSPPLPNPPYPPCQGGRATSRGRKGGMLVAVRSSATAEDSSTASWAGELESYLNTTKNNLLENVKHCWASLFTPRAIFYRFEKYSTKATSPRPSPSKGEGESGAGGISVAVVVQAMIQSEISGITFTVHPVTEDRNQMIIEAGWGLGEAIAGGKITPDSYVIDKKKMKIIDKNISEQKMMIVKGKKGTEEKLVPKARQAKQKLTDKQIIELARICYNIEKHYGKPQDIEWAIERGKIYVVQSRPITTLK